MKEEIGDLTKDMMMNKAEDLKKLMPKKGLKGGKAKEGVTEEVIEEVPASAPTETPTETPVEEKKAE